MVGDVRVNVTRDACCCCIQGISCAGQENIQELLTKQLLLCQFATALSILRRGGSFLCKTFDLFTPFTVGLVYLLRIAFERVTLMKPVTSRPANSERFFTIKSRFFLSLIASVELLLEINFTSLTIILLDHVCIYINFFLCCR